MLLQLLLASGPFNLKNFSSLKNVEMWQHGPVTGWTYFESEGRGFDVEIQFEQQSQNFKLPLE